MYEKGKYVKYVIVKTPQIGHQAILFPEGIPHISFANLNPIGAGMVRIDKDGLLETFGESAGLQIYSLAKDVGFIFQLLEELFAERS